MHKRKEASAEALPKIKKLEEGSKRDEKPRAWGKPNEEIEAKKKPSRFFFDRDRMQERKGVPVWARFG